MILTWKKFLSNENNNLRKPSKRIIMGFDYSHTCPGIDKSIKEFKNNIEYSLIDMLDECCPLLSDEVKKNLISGYVESIYDDFESSFEDVRKSNEDMRKAADIQIDEFESKNDDLKSELDDLKEVVNDLENELSAL